MANGFGVSYQPGAAEGPGRSGQGGGGFRGMSPQEAVRVLSLRVPERANPTGPISRTLMTAPGSAAPGGSALTSMVAQLMQAFSGGGGMGGFLPGGGPREDAGGGLPVPIDTGEIAPDVRGPQGPVIQPPTAGGGVRNPPPPRVTPGGDEPGPEMYPGPPPPPAEPPGPGREIVDGPTPVPQETQPETPGLFDERLELPPWLRIKAGQMPPLFGDDVQFG